MENKSMLGIAEQIKDLKKMLDTGAISQEEYENKKLALLNPEKEKLYLESIKLKNTNTYASLSQVIKNLPKIKDYKDSEKLFSGLEEKAEEKRKEEIYNKALTLKSNNSDIEKLNSAISLLESVKNYRNSESLINEIKDKITHINELAKANEERKIQQEIEKEKKRKSFLKKSVVIAIVAVIIGIVYGTIISPNIQYNAAIKQLNSGDYEQAAIVFDKLGGFKDSYDKYIESTYCLGKKQLDSEKFNEAINSFEITKDYENSKELLVEAKYGLALENFNKSVYDTQPFEELNGYKDSNKYLSYCLGTKDGISAKEARDYFKKASNVKDSKQIVKFLNDVLKCEGPYKDVSYKSKLHLDEGYTDCWYNTKINLTIIDYKFNNGNIEVSYELQDKLDFKDLRTGEYYNDDTINKYTETFSFAEYKKGTYFNKGNDKGWNLEKTYYVVFDSEYSKYNDKVVIYYKK